METTHSLMPTGETDDEVSFTCLACTRTIVVGKKTPKLIVIDEGEASPHVGVLSGLAAQMGDVMEVDPPSVVP
jgi:hypothetical protein